MQHVSCFREIHNYLNRLKRFKSLKSLLYALNIGDSANRTARHEWLQNKKTKQEKTNKLLNLTRSFITYLTSNLT